MRGDFGWGWYGKGRGESVTRPCQHARRRTVARDDATTYVECLDCKRFFETGELDDGDPPQDPPEITESLSDA